MKIFSLTYLIVSLFLIQFGTCDPQTPEVQTQINQTGASSSSQENTTTFILVRHAEKDTIGEDPMLTEAGKQRADELADMLKDVSINAVYSTNFNRTRNTAAPTAKAKGLEIQIYNHRDLSASANEILDKHPNGTVLIVGHSNSTPNYVNLLLGTQEKEHIDHSDYGNLYIVNTTQIGDAQVLHLHYGTKSAH